MHAQARTNPVADMMTGRVELCFNAGNSSERDETIGQNQEIFGRLVHLTQHSEPGKLLPRGSVASLSSLMVGHDSRAVNSGEANRVSVEPRAFSSARVRVATSASRPESAGAASRLYETE
jgi:hypothetical protein